MASNYPREVRENRSEGSRAEDGVAEGEGTADTHAKAAAGSSGHSQGGGRPVSNTHFLSRARAGHRECSDPQSLRWLKAAFICDNSRSLCRFPPQYLLYLKENKLLKWKDTRLMLF